MDSIQKLAELFAQFPGIGSRQSKRFVYFLLRQPKSYTEELSKLIGELKLDVIECSLCHRYFVQQREHLKDTCVVCADTLRERETLLIVEKDSDLESFERSHVYRGQYFVLGGTLQILEKSPEKVLRIRPLLSRIEALVSLGLKEVIIASSITPESEHTADYLRDTLKELQEKHKLTITMLGRGLSTGTELEYSDPETLRYALEGRK